MSEQLKRLMARARLMAEHDAQGSVGGGADDDDDEEEESSSSAQTKTEDNDDDEFVVEIEGEGDEQQAADKTEEGESEEVKREKIREDRRKERQERKQRQREKEESTKRQLEAERRARQELEQRLAQLEGRDRSREVAQVDEGITRAGRSYEHWKAQFATAMEQHDGAAATNATEKMLEAREAERQLKQMKVAIEKSQQTQGRPTANPVVVNHAQKFINENQWYKHGNNDDVDSRIVMSLDNDLAKEGWDPQTPEYWQELRARVKKYLPHRINSGKVTTVDTKTPTKQTKSVVGGGGGESAPAGKQTYTLSKERVQALKDAGMWNDPKKREEMIKQYRAFDKQNKKG